MRRTVIALFLHCLTLRLTGPLSTLPKCSVLGPTPNAHTGNDRRPLTSAGSHVGLLRVVDSRATHRAKRPRLRPASGRPGGRDKLVSEPRQRRRHQSASGERAEQTAPPNGGLVNSRTLPF